MDAGESSSGLNRPGSIESVAVGSSIGPDGVVASQTGDSRMIGVPGEAETVIQRGEEQHVATMGAAGMSCAATVGPVLGQVRKRGRPPKGQTPKPPPPKRIKEVEEEEDVCFICFDGGNLVLCDRKGCPKAYHPTCIKRDESFFQSTSRWTCGWHICSVCMKAAHYKCYTCTYSLCKKCAKDAEYICVRGNNGFCATCMKPIMLIENEGGINKEMVDFNDRSSFEYLFKVYWDVLKEKLSLTVSELKQAKNPGGGFVRADIKPQPLENSAEDGSMPNLPKSYEHSEVKIVKEQVQLPDQNSLSTGNPSHDESTTLDGSGDWASRELVEFVAHIKNGDTTVISQFDAQALLVEYIKTNNLRDPRRKSQINCDERLKSLFGKPCVGHIEMLKLLEYHFPKNDDTQKKSFIPAGIVGSLANHVGVDQHNSPVLNHAKRRKSRSRREDETPQTNLDDYAAINVHNINLIFLRRSMLENLFGEVENFHDKVVGSIVRIRVSTNDQKHDMYRLVQVVGTNKLSEPYKLGDKTADIMIEVLNLNKKETMPIDAISDQDFSEDECKRLRQSIKFGLVERLKVGEIQMKSIALLAAKLDDGLTNEILRLSHLRDRASEKGRKKELRECIEKLQILKTPEECQRRLSEIPEVHADPKMHPDYESEDDAAGEDEISRLRYSNFNRNQSVYPKRGVPVKDDEPISSQKLQEKSDGGRSNSCCVKQDNHATAGDSVSVGGNQAVLRSDPEPVTLAIPTGDPQSIKFTEMDQIWCYRDPNGKIQGPFTMSQLRKWSTTGYFPTNMSIWNKNEQDCSILLSDALNGDFYNLSQSLHSMSTQSRKVGNAVDNIVHVVCSSVTASAAAIQDGDSTYQLKSVHEFDRAETKSHSYVCQSFQQNQGSVPLNLDLNDQDSNTASVTNPCKSSEQKCDLNLLDLPNPTLETDSINLECQSSERPESALEIRPAEVQSTVSIDIHSKNTGISDLQNPIPNSMDEDQQRPSSNPTVKDHACKPSDEGLGGQIAVSEQPLPSKIPTEDLGWNSASGQMVGGGKMQGIANDWEWESGNISMSLKLPEMVGNLVTTPISNQHPHSSPSHPAPNVPNWHSINEPIEFSTLAEESVSDLLAEYDAMESHSGLGSPTSAARCVDDMMDRNDCFSSIEDLSPVPDAGKSDALSSTEDIPFPSLAAVMDDLFGTPDADAFDPLKMSGGQSTTSSEGETKSADATTVSPWEAGSDMHPPPTCTMSQVMVSANMAHGSRGLETMDAAGWATTVQGNMNLGCAGAPQNFVNIDWGPNPGTQWMDPNFNVGAYNSNVGWNSPRRYSSGDRFAVSRDWPFQGGDLGFGRGSSRSTWGGRQSHGGGGGGYSSRPSSRGQRICKFYESGHCKKGAACDYLHP